jgi:hypothetical protein
MVIAIIVTAIIVYLYMAGNNETFIDKKKESFVGASQLDPVNEMAKLIDGGGCGGCGCGSVVGGCVGGGCVGGGCRK